MNKNTILIAEDDKQIAGYIIKSFERLNFNIVKSFDGEETVRKAFDTLPDVILLDILMPRMDGIAVIKELRAANSPCIETPIIVLSALDKIHEKRFTIDAGANKYLCKPMFTEDIVNEVLKWVKK